MQFGELCCHFFMTNKIRLGRQNPTWCMTSNLHRGWGSRFEKKKNCICDSCGHSGIWFVYINVFPIYKKFWVQYLPYTWATYLSHSHLQYMCCSGYYSWCGKNYISASSQIQKVIGPEITFHLLANIKANTDINLYIFSAGLFMYCTHVYFMKFYSWYSLWALWGFCSVLTCYPFEFAFIVVMVWLDSGTKTTWFALERRT